MFSTMNVDKEANLSSCVCEYHVSMLFGVQQSEKSCSVQEVGNVKDRYAISVLHGSDVVGHLLQMISRINKSGSWNIM